MKRVLCIILAVLCCMSCVIALAACGEEEPAEGEGKSDGNIYYMMHGDVKIELGKDAAGVLSALGEAKSVQELGDCGGFGAQVKYVYNDFNIYTLKNDSGETIDQITFTNDLAVTSKNICNSSTKEAVIKAYGEPTVSTDKELRYTNASGEMILKFSLDNGIVSSIDYIRISK